METGVWCFVFCFGSTKGLPVVAAEGFCATYQQQVMTKEEVKALKRLPRALQERMLANDLQYLCVCKQWKDKACGGS